MPIQTMDVTRHNNNNPYGPISAISGDPFRPKKSDVEETRAWRRKIDFMSACLSLVALVWLGFRDDALAFRFNTWSERTVVTRHATTRGVIMDFSKNISGQCVAKEPKDALVLSIFNVTQEEKHKTAAQLFTGIPLPDAKAQTNPSQWLMWVFVISASFQSFRYTASHSSTYESERVKTNFQAYDIFLFLATFFSVSFVVINAKLYEEGNRLFCLMLILVPIFNWFYACHNLKYNDETADFWRWVEYAITSPLQIAIVASSVWMGDRSTLVILALLQGLLVLGGYATEMMVIKVQKLHAKLLESPNEMTCSKRHKKINEATTTLLLTLAMYWFVFFFIWYVPIARFYIQDRSSGTCDMCESYLTTNTCDNSMCLWDKKTSKCVGENPIPSIVVYMLWTQAALFALFGVVQSMQIYTSVTMLRNLGMDVPTATSDSAAKQTQTADDFREKVRESWIYMAFEYTILSVLSKTSLELFYLIMLGEMPAFDGPAAK